MCRGAELVERRRSAGARRRRRNARRPVQPVVAGRRAAGSRASPPQPCSSRPSIRSPPSMSRRKRWPICGARDAHAIRADGPWSAAAAGGRPGRAASAASRRIRSGRPRAAARRAASRAPTDCVLRRARRASPAAMPAASAMARNWSSVLMRSLGHAAASCLGESIRATVQRAGSVPVPSAAAAPAGFRTAARRHGVAAHRLGAEVGGDGQRAAVAEPPAGQHAPSRPTASGAQRRGAGQMRDDAGMADRQQPAVQGEHRVMRRVARLRPDRGSRRGRSPSAFGSGMRARFAGSWKAANFGEFLAPPVAHQRREFGIVVGEEQEGRRGRPFLAHEQHGDLRREQQQRGRRGAAPRGRPALAAARRRRGCRPGRGSAGTARRRSAADGRRARRAARRDGRESWPWNRKPSASTRRQLGGAVLGEILVVALALAGQQRVQDVVAVVVPLGVEVAGAAAGGGRRCARSPAPDGRGDPGSRARMRAASTSSQSRLGDGVHGIEAQPVEAVLVQPEQRVVLEEVAHRRPRGSRSRRPRGYACPRRRSAWHRRADRRRPGRNGCRRRRGRPSARGRAPHRSAPSARRACRARCPAHRAARRHSPSCARRGNRRSASARSR